MSHFPIDRYQLILFDFDGLLVDTERLHYRAYQRMCQARGISLTWSFSRYSAAAHHGAHLLREHLYAAFPELQAQEPEWSVLYGEKQAAFLTLIEEEPVPLMPGVAEWLMRLKEKQIRRCVVTHSPHSLIVRIRQKNPLLDTIPHWITRETYRHPKPDPECYEMAITRYASLSDQVVGFEDSPRGLQALMGTRADAVLICSEEAPYLSDLLSRHASLSHYSSFEMLSI